VRSKKEVAPGSLFRTPCSKVLPNKVDYRYCTKSGNHKLTVTVKEQYKENEMHGLYESTAKTSFITIPDEAHECTL
jgi:hypothetical protein